MFDIDVGDIVFDALYPDDKGTVVSLEEKYFSVKWNNINYTSDDPGFHCKDEPCTYPYSFLGKYIKKES